jgi:sulfite reductase (ferredoxin)
MIEVDLKIINSNKAALETETDATQRNNRLYDIVYSASRMLLVTRGLEPRTTDEVFGMFIENFIETGFVDEKFSTVVAAARNNKEFAFEPHKDELYALADRVILLYENMDDSLQFKNIKVESQPTAEPEKKETVENTENKVRKFKNLRGVACPMNFVQTKIQLSSMQSGEELEIWLDDGQPIANVPGSVRAEGHDVLEQTPVEEYWKVIIRKK